jgi:uncharacterized protein YukE
MAENLSEDHQLRSLESVPFSVDDDGRSVEEIKTLILRLDPMAIQSAAESYLAGAKQLTSLNDTLVSQATMMAQIWEGPSSVESQQSLRTLHATIRELAAKFTAVGLPLQAFGKRLQQHQKFVEDKGGSWSTHNPVTWDDSFPGWYLTMNAGWEWGSRDELAGQHLRLLNNDMLDVYQDLPFYLRKVVPDIKYPTPSAPEVVTTDGPADYRIDPRSLTAPGGDPQSPGIDGIGDPPPIDSAMPDLPDGTLDSPGTYPDENLDPSTTGADGRYPDGTYPDDGDPGTRDPNGTNPNGVNLAGSSPNGVNPNLTANAAMPDASGPNTPDSRTTLEDFQRPAGWDPSTSTSVPNSGSPYSVPGTGSGTGPGGAMIGSGGLPLNARSASVTGSGMPFLPMGGAGAGANEPEDKENSTWLHEDDDVWGTDTDGAVSDKIG